MSTVLKLSSSDFNLFSNNQFNDLRVFIDSNGQYWFNGQDVATNLQINDGHIYDKVSSDDILQISTDIKCKDNITRIRKIYLISECGVYTIIMRSNSPKAKKFKKWITHEVLPSIRKTGVYSINKPDSDNKFQPTIPNTYIEALEDYVKALKENQKLESEKLMLEEQAKINAPKVEFADNLIAEDTKALISFGNMASILKANGVKTGTYRLLRKFRESGLVKSNGSAPTNKGVDSGYIKPHTCLITKDNNRTEYVMGLLTAKGQQFVLKSFGLMVNSIDQLPVQIQLE